MKSEIRTLGIDDCPFNFKKDAYTHIIGVVLRGNSYIEGILSRDIEIDGTDATAAIIEMINNSRYKRQLKAVIIDGAAVGGFNVIDIEELHKETHVPVITVTRDLPDTQAMLAVLKKKFKDWKRRWEIINKTGLFEAKIEGSKLYISCAGIGLDAAEEILKVTTKRGNIPEPVRIAHMIASGITSGESHGRA